MGYEIKMFVVDRSRHRLSDSVLIEGQVYSCYHEILDDKNSKYIYYPDHNTTTYVPEDSIIKSGKFCSIIGMIDLCKCSINIQSICSFENSDGDYMFAPDDGNKIIGLDNYGDYRKFVPIKKVIKALKDIIAEDKKNGTQSYRRFTIALAMLKEINKTFKGSDVGCMFYGH